MSKDLYHNALALLAGSIGGILLAGVAFQMGLIG